MKMMKPLLTTILSASLLTSAADAQVSYFDLLNDRNLMLNIGGGTANYFGDFVNPGTLGIIRPNINIEAEYFWTDYISARAELGWFQLAGKDANANDDRWERNLRFKSNALDLKATAAIHLFPQNSTFYPRPKFNPYVYAGVGMMWNNPKTDYNGDMVALQPLRTEDIKYNRIQLVLPTGVGFKVQLTPYWNLIAQGGLHWTFTDYLDDVSRERYPNPIVLTSDLARILSDRRGEIGTKPSDPLNVGKRGNPDKNDHYLLLNLKLQYYLPVYIFPNRGTRERKPRRVKEEPYVAPVAAAVVAPVVLDTDKDGIVDSLDKCVTVPGVPEYSGCPIPDSDGDGILDPSDKCPTVPGVVEYEGCPVPDRDNDGIADNQDLCPNVPGFVQYKGCPEIVLYYKRDVSTLNNEDRAQLDSVVTFLKAHPNLNVVMEGHTSTLGTDAYNLKLSQARAENSKKYLVSKGIAPGRVTLRWFGEKFPIGDNSKEEGRSLSRRVVVKLDMEKH